MAKKNPGGRPTIFGKRDGGTVNARLTKYATQKFEHGRRRLAQLAGWEPEDVSDGDTVEFLERGEAETLKFLGLKK